MNSISTFNKHLSVLERTAPGRSAPTRLADSPPPQRGGVSLARPAFAPGGYRATAPVLSRRQARERRKNVLLALAGGVVTTLVLAVFVGGVTVYLQILADLMLAAYVAVLVQIRRLADERRAKVRFLPESVPAVPEPQTPMLLQHSAH